MERGRLLAFVVLMRAVDIEVSEQLHGGYWLHLLEIRFDHSFAAGVHVGRGHGVRLLERGVVQAVDRR